jgi:hypothetical protein
MLMEWCTGGCGGGLLLQALLFLVVLDVDGAVEDGVSCG